MRKPDGIERLYIDFDSFFASAEQQLQPRLRGRPVGILPMWTRHSCIIAASREAKKAGVKTGTSVMEARQLCPDIAFALARHDQYVRLHHRIVAELERHVPVSGVRSIDEMVCALLPSEAREAEALAGRIKAGLAENLGPFLTASIGFAPTELLAKIAAELDKPDGLVILYPGDLPGRLLDLGLTDIPGISRGMSRRLALAGIHDVAALWRLQPKQARAIWGSVTGERFLAQLQGFAVEQPPTQRRMFGHGRVLPPDWRGPERARACARLLTVKAARRMRREAFSARAFSFSVREEAGGRWGATDRFLSAARDDHSFLASLDRLHAAWMTGAGKPRARAVHVMLHELEPVTSRQFDLFEMPGRRHAKARWEVLSDIGDGLHRRYGRDVLEMGVRSEPPGGYAGGKIAFTRIPDLLDFQ